MSKSILFIIWLIIGYYLLSRTLFNGELGHATKTDVYVVENNDTTHSILGLPAGSVRANVKEQTLEIGEVDNYGHLKSDSNSTTHKVLSMIGLDKKAEQPVDYYLFKRFPKLTEGFIRIDEYDSDGLSIKRSTTYTVEVTTITSSPE